MIGRVEFVVKALEEAKVRYLVVGGVAVVLHGHLRTTLDLDLVVHLDPDNLARALETLDRLGFQPQVPVSLRSFADEANRTRWTREKNMTVFSVVTPAFPGFAVDLFVEEPFDFEAVYGRALLVPLFETEIRVVALDDLIAMKRGAGRPADLLDIQALTELREKAI